MRLALLIMTLAALLPIAARLPHVGLLLWGWLTVMQPHQEVWGLPGWLKLNLITAVVTIGAWLLSREPKLPSAGLLPLLFAGFAGWLIISQLNSLVPDYSWIYFDRHWRVLAFVFLCLVLLNRRPRLHAMIWVLVISIGYHAVTGGVFTIVTGGRHIVLGPPDSMIGDNNHVGIAIVTMIPLMIYLWQHSRVRFVRWGLAATIFLSAVAVFGSFSRGAAISFAVMCALLLLKSRRKLATAVVVAILVVSGMTIMSQFWEQRMQTIAEYDTDASFQGRVDAWIIAYEAARARPLTGLGPRVPYLQAAVDPYLSEPRKVAAAHSIYFEVLGSMGYPALALFLAILAVTWRNLRWIERQAREAPELKWAGDLAAMAQVSLLAFMVGGASVSLEFWEGFWLLVVIGHRARQLVRAHLSAPAPAGRPAALSSPLGAELPR